MYRVGIDLGTSFAAAAVTSAGTLDMVRLAGQAIVTPSVAYLDETGTLLTGEAADRLGLPDPGRAAREFKRRLGDPTPVILAGAPFSPTALMAALLRSILDAVSHAQGGPPDRIVLTHPAVWGPYRREQFAAIPHLAGLPRPQADPGSVADSDGPTVLTVTEPVAAATYYCSIRPLPPDSLLAVYDLGGGTFDSAVVRNGRDGLEIVGTPEGIEWLGGADFDQAIVDYVDRQLGGAITALDPNNPDTAPILAALHRDCMHAKEALSTRDQAEITVPLPDAVRHVAVTREAFEQMITPSVETTVETFRRTLTAAGITPQDLTAVLLVGGSSQIPLVSQLLRDTLRRPIMINTHPKHAVALGAAMLGADARTAHSIPAPRRPEPAAPMTMPVAAPVTAPVFAPVIAPISTAATTMAAEPATVPVTTPATAPAAEPDPDSAPAAAAGRDDSTSTIVVPGSPAHRARRGAKGRSQPPAEPVRAATAPLPAVTGPLPAVTGPATAASGPGGQTRPLTLPPPAPRRGRTRVTAARLVVALFVALGLLSVAIVYGPKALNHGSAVPSAENQPAASVFAPPLIGTTPSPTPSEILSPSPQPDPDPDPTSTRPSRATKEPAPSRSAAAPGVPAGGTGLIHSVATGLCVDSDTNPAVALNGVPLGGHAFASKCSGSTSQLWREGTPLSEDSEHGNGWYRLLDQQTGFCLDSNGDGAIYTLPCINPNDYQLWQRVIPARPPGVSVPANRLVAYRNKATNRCVSLAISDRTLRTLPCPSGGSWPVDMVFQRQK